MLSPYASKWGLDPSRGYTRNAFLQVAIDPALGYQRTASAQVAPDRSTQPIITATDYETVSPAP